VIHLLRAVHQKVAGIGQHPGALAVPGRKEQTLRVEFGGQHAAALTGPDDGDRIRLDVAKGTLDVLVDPAEVDARKAGFEPPPRYTTGVLAKYTKPVGSAAGGAVCGSGGRPGSPRPVLSCLTSARIRGRAFRSTRRSGPAR